MECSLLERSASQSLSQQEYELLFGQEGEPDVVVPLVTTLHDRSRVAKVLRREGSDVKFPSSVPVSVLDHCYVSNRLAKAVVHDEGGPLLAILTKNRLVLLTMNDIQHAKAPLSIPLDLSYDSQIALHALARDGLLLVSQQQQQKRIRDGRQRPPSHSSIAVSAVQLLDPSDIVRALVHEGKHQEAIDASMKLSSIDQNRISETIQSW